jgi:hypothetical protein
MSLLRFVLLLCLVSLVTAAGSTSSVVLPWCDGSLQFREFSRVVWTRNADDPSTSFLEYSICTRQSRAVSAIQSVRLTVLDADTSFAICSSRIDCLKRGMQQRPDGLFCQHGRVLWGFPVFDSPNGTNDVRLRLLDPLSRELGSFCGVY